MIGFSLEGRHCSFCGNADQLPDQLVSGYGALICLDCVDGYHDAKTASPVSPVSSTTDSSAGGLKADDPWAETPTPDLLANLELIVSTKRQVDDFLQAYVDMLRERRLSWASIGGALGVSRQAAWERFSRPRTV